MSPKIIEQLAPKGVLRVAINLSNFLLVTDRSAEGNPAGVSPDMAISGETPAGFPSALRSVTSRKFERLIATRRTPLGASCSMIFGDILFFA